MARLGDQSLAEQIGEGCPHVPAHPVGNVGIDNGEVGRQRQPRAIPCAARHAPVRLGQGKVGKLRRSLFTNQVPFDDHPIGAGAVEVRGVPPPACTEHVQVEVPVADLERIVGPAHPRQSLAERHLALRVLEQAPQPAPLLVRGDDRRLRVVVEAVPIGAAEPVREGDEAISLVQYADDRSAVTRQRAEQLRIQPVVGVLVAEHLAIQHRRLCELRRSGERDGPEHCGPLEDTKRILLAP